MTPLVGLVSGRRFQGLVPFAIWVPACERMNIKSRDSPTDSDLYTLRFGIRRFLHARELLLPSSHD